MKAPRLQPIPTPPLQRLRHFKTTFLPGLIFCGAIVFIGLLWRDRFAAPTMIGPTEGLAVNGPVQILAVSTQLEGLPSALQSSGKLAGAGLALPVNISLPAVLDLRPGELVDRSVIPSTQ